MNEDSSTPSTNTHTVEVDSSPIIIFNATNITTPRGDSFYGFLHLPPLTAKERVAGIHRGVTVKVEDTLCKCYKKALNKPTPNKVFREINRISCNFAYRVINLHYRLDLLQNKLQIRTKDRIELLDYGRGLTNYDATVNLLTMYYNFSRE